MLMFAGEISAQVRLTIDGSRSQSFDAESELQTGTSLTSQGQFSEAIPHLLAASGHVQNEDAAGFNLALCYVGTRQFAKAIDVLKGLDIQGRGRAGVDNLLAQAYVGNQQPKQAWEVFVRAANATPTNEKLYLFIADACMGKRDYELGFRVADFGLQHLPDSARLHYERAAFLSLLDQFDRAKPDFEAVARLAPGSDFAYMAASEKSLLEGDNAQAIATARQAVAHGVTNYIVLQILGEALIRNGAAPGEPAFTEAKGALEKSVALRPDYARSRISLGTLYRMEGRLDEALAQLQQARQMDPGNPAIYTQLAAVYRRRGDTRNTQDMLAILARINAAQADRIRNSDEGARMGYAGRSSATEASQPH